MEGASMTLERILEEKKIEQQKMQERKLKHAEELARLRTRLDEKRRVVEEKRREILKHQQKMDQTTILTNEEVILDYDTKNDEITTKTTYEKEITTNKNEEASIKNNEQQVTINETKNENTDNSNEVNEKLVNINVNNSNQVKPNCLESSPAHVKKTLDEARSAREARDKERERMIQILTLKQKSLLQLNPLRSQSERCPSPRVTKAHDTTLSYLLPSLSVPNFNLQMESSSNTTSSSSSPSCPTPSSSLKEEGKLNIQRATKERRVRTMAKLQNTVDKFRGMKSNQGVTGSLLSPRYNDNPALQHNSNQNKSSFTPFVLPASNIHSHNKPPTDNVGPSVEKSNQEDERKQKTNLEVDDEVLHQKLQKEKERQQFYVQKYGLTASSTPWTKAGSARLNSKARKAVNFSPESPAGGSPSDGDNEEKKLKTKSRRLAKRSQRMTKQINAVQNEAQINNQLQEFLQSMIQVEREMQAQMNAKNQLEKQVSTLEHQLIFTKSHCAHQHQVLTTLNIKYPDDPHIREYFLIQNNNINNEEQQLLSEIPSHIDVSHSQDKTNGTLVVPSERRTAVVVTPLATPPSTTVATAVLKSTSHIDLLKQIREGMTLKKVEADTMNSTTTGQLTTSATSSSSILGTAALDIFQSLQNTLHTALKVRQNKMNENSEEDNDEDQYNNSWDDYEDEEEEEEED